MALFGNEFIVNPPPPLSLMNSSVIILWGIDMPSPMKRNTYFTESRVRVCAAQAEKHESIIASAEKNLNIRFIYTLMMHAIPKNVKCF